MAKAMEGGGGECYICEAALQGGQSGVGGPGPHGQAGNRLRQQGQAGQAGAEVAHEAGQHPADGGHMQQCVDAALIVAPRQIVPCKWFQNLNMAP